MTTIAPGHGPGMLAVPAIDWLWTDSALALFDAVSAAGADLSVELGAPTVARKRNLLAQRFLTSAAPWILFLDSDMVPPPDVAQRLLAHGRDIVSGLYVMRRAPYLPMAWREQDGTRVPMAERTGLHAVDGVGFGCVLVRRVVFERISGPWFVASSEGMLEDVSFCTKARAAGFQLWVDADLPIGHIGAATYQPPRPAAAAANS